VIRHAFAYRRSGIAKTVLHAEGDIHRVVYLTYLLSSISEKPNYGFMLIFKNVIFRINFPVGIALHRRNWALTFSWIRSMCPVLPYTGPSGLKSVIFAANSAVKNNIGKLFVAVLVYMYGFLRRLSP
jgi:predicted Na+-dependent transporter